MCVENSAGRYSGKGRSRVHKQTSELSSFGLEKATERGV